MLLRNFHDVQNRNNSEYSIADYFKLLSTRKFTYYSFIRDVLLKYVLLCLLYDTIVMSCRGPYKISPISENQINMVEGTDASQARLVEFYEINVDLLKC